MSVLLYESFGTYAWEYERPLSVLYLQLNIESICGHGVSMKEDLRMRVLSSSEDEW